MTKKRFQIVDATSQDIKWIRSNPTLFGKPLHDPSVDPATQKVLIARMGENIVGYIKLKMKENDCEIKELSTVKRLSRIGIGSKLMGAAHAYALRNSKTWMTVHPMDSAKGFYRRLGYYGDQDGYSHYLDKSLIPHPRMRFRKTASKLR